MAAVKKITKRVISKVAPQTAPIEEVAAADEQKNYRSKKVCFFCQSKTLPTYTDLQTLKRFFSDRSKIIPKSKSNVCSKHQRAVTRHIKYARHLSLLPFTPKV